MIYVVSHKNLQLPLPEGYQPLQVGGAAENFPGFARDNTGENIAEKNPSYCELTALYWIWKNTDEPYAGLVHYRRFFGKKGYSSRFGDIYSEPEVRQILEDCANGQKSDIILAAPVHYHTDAKGQLLRSSCTEDTFVKLRRIIEEQEKEYLPEFDRFFSENKASLYNMMYCRKELLDAYASWLFPILFTLEPMLDLESMNAYQRRVFGFLSERLLNIWVRKNGLRFVYLPIVNTGYTRKENLLYARRDFTNEIRYRLGKYKGARGKGVIKGQFTKITSENAETRKNNNGKIAGENTENEKTGTPLTIDELKVIEKGILKRFDEICAKEGLRYSIAYGTLLGAMRHGGFIPWDDDVDVVMPREDYDRLLALGYDDGAYRILDYHRDKEYYYSFAKMIDLGTEIHEHYRADRPMGVFIDIFPMDYFKDDETYYASYDERMADRNIQFRNGFLISKETTPSMPLRMARYARRAGVLPFRKKILEKLEKKYISGENEAREAKSCAFAFSMWKKDVYPKTMWESLKRIPFEDIEVTAFADTEAYLGRAFRNWRQLPPEEERHSDHDFEAYRV